MMQPPRRVAFYAPMKSPLSPVPSGDRTMARLLMAALEQAGFQPFIASELNAREGRGVEALQRAIAEAAEREAQGLIARWRASPTERPALWFTYHCYYKAPDWLGPTVSRALDIPYLVAEGSRAGKRAAGPFAFAHGGAEAALDAADIIFAMTATDRKALERAKPRHQALLDLRPFIDMPESLPPRGPTAGNLRLLTVAMMREGDKLNSYTLLADALAQLGDFSWHLDIVGDGPARPAIEPLFAPFGPRVTVHGRIDSPDRLQSLYNHADLFVWPAVNEAYGMVLLEALAAGCPVLAGNEGGVASVVRDGEDGVLTPKRDAAAFAVALRVLAADPARLVAMGASGARHVREHHSLIAAASMLKRALGRMLDRRS